MTTLRRLTVVSAALALALGLAGCAPEVDSAGPGDTDASAEQLIYCQHVPGATDHAENSAVITLEGSTITPPSPHKGFEVLAWSEDTMLWKNNYIASTTYLLVRSSAVRLPKESAGSWSAR